MADAYTHNTFGKDGSCGSGGKKLAGRQKDRQTDTPVAILRHPDPPRRPRCWLARRRSSAEFINNVLKYYRRRVHGLLTVRWLATLQGTFLDWKYIVESVSQNSTVHFPCRKRQLKPIDESEAASSFS